MRPRFRLRSSCDTGLTIVEVVVAVALLGFFTIGTLTLTSTVVKGTGQHSEMARKDAVEARIAGYFADTPIAGSQRATLCTDGYAPELDPLDDDPFDGWEPSNNPVTLNSSYSGYISVLGWTTGRTNVGSFVPVTETETQPDGSAADCLSSARLFELEIRIMSGLEDVLTYSYVQEVN